MKKQYWWLIGLLALGSILGIYLFYRPATAPLNGGGAEQTEVEAGLTLRDVTLEQQDENGQLLWKVSAKEVTYSPDKKIANLVQPEGELFQDGEVIYRVKADQGVIQENGKTILLEKNISAEGIENQMLLKGQQLEWFPEDSLLIVRNGITGTHPQFRAKANEALVFNRDKRMELKGQVVATTVVQKPAEEPWIKLQGEFIAWLWEEEKIRAEQPVRVERFEQQKITEVLVGDQGLVELAQNRVTLVNNVKAQLLDVPLELTSNQVVWDLERQTINTEQPVRVVNQQQNVVVTAQKGAVNLAQKVVVFDQDVLAIGQASGSRLTANRLTWNLTDQTVLAEGAVNYQQSDPQITVRGARAQGRIEEQTVVVDGGQVVTEIVPNSN